MKEARDQYSRKWAEYEKAWKMIEEKRSGQDAWRAALPETWSFATIKTAQAAFVDSKVSPIIIRHEDDPRDKSEDLKNLYADVGDKGNIDEELYFIRLDAFKLGNGYGKTIYVHDKRTVWDIKRFDTEKNTYEWEKKEVDEFDDPKTIRVSPYLMLVDDLARANNGTIRDRIELEVMGRDEAEARYGHLVKDWGKIPQTTLLLDELKESPTTQIAETDGKGLRGTEFESLSKYSFFAPGFDWSDDYVEVMHYWNSGILTPSGCLDSKEMLINGYPVQVDTKRKPSPIPYIHKQIPYFDVKYSPYSGDEHYAAGIIEIGRAEGKAIQKHREMMSDRQKISLFSPVFSDVNDEIDQRQLQLKPLSIIRTKGGRPTALQIPGLTNADLALQESYEAAYKRAVGIDERVLGVESTGPRLTATEINFLRESAMRRLREFAFLYKNTLLHHEIKLKLSLFKQYFSNPLSREDKVKNDKGARYIKGKAKEFKIKVGNTYTRKSINPNFFEGETDVDLDMQLLLPMTQAQMATIWSQILRDAVPFVQAGVVDLSLEKTFGKYVEALGTNIDALREDTTEMSIRMAEDEHNLYADDNMSKKMRDILPDGTPEQYLTPRHILKHTELIESDVEMSDQNKARLIAHIKKDMENLTIKRAKVLQESQRPVSLPGQAEITNVGGINAPAAIPSPIQPPQVPS